MITKIISFGYDYNRPPKTKDGKNKPPRKTHKKPPFPKMDDFRRKKSPFENWNNKKHPPKPLQK